MMEARRRSAGLVGAMSVVLAAALVAWAAPGGVAAEDELRMVALGDSSAAGPLTGVPSSVECARSTNNWPAVAAGLLDARLTDVTCSGAVTADLTGRRFGYLPAQLDAVTPETDLVALAIGANDLGLGSTVPSCLQLLPEPYGVSCRTRLTADGDPTDAQLEELAPRLAAALREIHDRAPAAQVVVTGYLTYWQPDGCYPRDPIWARDANWLQSIFDRLHATLRTTAEAHGARYVDLRTPSSGHGVCAPAGARWVEGLVPLSPAAPYHPNAAGMAAAGALVAEALE